MFLNAVKAVAKQILLLLLLFALTRLIFYFYNANYFKIEVLPSAMFFGMRFDLMVICILNGPLFFVLLLPFKFIQLPIFKRIYLILFLLVNAAALLLNCIDIGFFEFIQKRSTFDLFATMGGENDGRQVIFNYLIDYWYLLFLWFGLIILILRFTKFPIINSENITIKRQIIQIFLIIILVIPIIVLGARGGWQYRPIDMITASNYAEGKNVSLVLNTPFCIMKSANKAQLEKRHYIDESKILEIYSPYHFTKDTLPFQQKNVVVIVMESFGSEYTALAKDGKSLTPFLDSLSQKSTQFVNAFANGKTSIKGIPAIIAGLPTLFDGSFTYSAYNANSFESIASTLKKKGYTTSFFHGGNNGTMGFDVFSKAAGFDKYIGRNEYPNQKDFDEHWGIYDEPFFQFFKAKLDHEKIPFASCFFSLSSHHPYTIPLQYKDKFKGNDLAIAASVQYADYALMKFFNEAKKSSWYDNTIFVITADHTSMSKNEKYQTETGIYSIPLIVFEPSNNMGNVVDNTIQQIDIFPTILNKLHYNIPYFAFGKAIDEPAESVAISFNGQYYQLITNTRCLQFDGEKTIAVYDIVKDSFMKTNLVSIKGINYQKEENLLKAMIQTYNQCLIDNKMIIEK
jgi:phosphoglycerol transferase MdoB-like AlkP superfamily enzyme